MSTDVVMPQLGNEITEAQIDYWSRSPGEKVEKGEMLLTITTPKLTMEIEAPASGTLREIRVEARAPRWNLAVGSFWFDHFAASQPSQARES